MAQLADHLEQLPHAARHHGPGGEHVSPPQVLKVDRADDEVVITFA